jgi:hypothetical protein
MDSSFGGRKEGLKEGRKFKEGRHFKEGRKEGSEGRK